MIRRYLTHAALWAYEVIAWATFVFLTFYDGYIYTSWNWLIAVPVNLFVSQFWPLYWLIWRHLF